MDDYKQWVQYTDLMVNKQILQKASVPPYLLNMYGLMMLKKMDETKMKMPVEKRGIFTVIVHVRLLEHLLNWFLHSRYSYEEIEDTCYQLIGSVSSQIEKGLEQLPEPLPFSFDSLYKPLQKDVRELLFLEGPFKSDVLSVYWLLWRKFLIRQPSLQNDELRFARETAKRGNTGSSWHISYIFQLVLAGRTDDALHELKKVETKEPDLILSIIQYYVSAKHWQEAGKMISFFIEHVRKMLSAMEERKIPPFLQSAANILQKFAEQTGKFEYYEQALIQMLPYSSRELAAFYFERRNYKKYIEFIQAAGLEDISGYALKTIMQEDPSLLLPYYHQAVKKAILRKNRQSYKEAVRALKKLRSIYKKLKKEHVCDRYFQDLMGKTRRLRAFREECQRGKLIHVED